MAPLHRRADIQGFATQYDTRARLPRVIWRRVCMCVWADHGTSYFQCNKFRGSAAGGAAATAGAATPSGSVSDVSRARADLERYLFYFDRYENHNKSARFAEKHREAATRRIAELQEVAGGMSYIDSAFLYDATEALLEV